MDSLQPGPTLPITETTGGASSAAPLLEVHDLTVAFPARTGLIVAAHDVSFEVAEGETVGVVGESGSGKSVTLRSLLGLVPYPGEVINGRISWKSRDVAGLRKNQLRRLRGGEIAMIFQDPMSALNPVLSIGSQLVEAVKARGQISRREAADQAVSLLRDVGLPRPAQQLAAYPHQLSGGMRQRVMIALALAQQPKLLLADEPTTALDVTIQDQILTLLRDTQARTGMSMIFVSHDLGVIAQVADRILVMYAGRIMEQGPWADVLSHPRHPYSRSLLAALPSIDPAYRRRLATIPGQPPDLANPSPGCPFQPRCDLSRPACATVPMTLDRSPPGHGTACPFVEP
jgi:oligopeptide/dipeptide ABC transporter ATP-binding protein